MRAYYAYRNRSRDVRALSIEQPENIIGSPLHDEVEEL